MASLDPDSKHDQAGSQSRALCQRYGAGPDNPLGARALYLFENGRDTLYRIHGTNEPWSIGRAISSGCIRLFNQDIIDLYHRVPRGSRVLVLQHDRPGTIA